MHLTPWHVVGLLATIALIIGVGIYSCLLYTSDAADE